MILTIIVLSIIPTNIYGVKANTNEELVPVMIFLNTKIDYSYISVIKSSYYQELQFAKDWNEVDSLLDSMRKRIFEYIKYQIDPYLDEIDSYIESIGGKIIHHIETIGVISALVPREKILDLWNHPLVRFIRKPLYYRIQLYTATKAIYADVWWNNGFNGSNDIGDEITGVEVAVLDTGVDLTHKDLAPRIIDSKDFTDENNPDDLNGHGTMVAGIIASIHTDTKPYFKGVAFKANIINAKCLKSNGEGREDWILAAVQWAITQATDTAEIINTSFGTNEVPPDGESTLTKFIDTIIDTYGVAWTTAAGNRDDEAPNPLQLNVPGDGFNLLTVGAVNDKTTDERDDDEWASFSCIGPTTDGRIKPDIVAPGESILSTYLANQTGVGSGTSFSAPMVAGALALVAPYLIPIFSSDWYLAAKALLINSADDWRVSGPDNYTGWGYINLYNSWLWKDYIIVDSIASDEVAVYSIYAENNSKVIVTLVWNRRSKDPTLLDFYSLTDLRIELRTPNDETVLITPYSPDNVRQIVFTANETGYYRILVYVASMDSELDTELFAIASSNPIYSGIVSSDLVVDLQTEASAYDSEIVVANVTIKNVGSDAIQNVKLNVTTTPGLTLLNQSIPISVGDIQPNSTKFVLVYLKPLETGKQTIGTIAYYVENGALLISSESVKVNIIDDDTAPPVIQSTEVSGSTLIFRKIVITAIIQDESGISEAILYYKVGSSDITENSYDGKVTMQYDEETGQYFAEILIRPDWIGKTIYFRIKAVDADNDRPNDESSTWSSAISVEIPLTLNVAVLGSIVILLIIIIAAIYKKITG